MEREEVKKKETILLDTQEAQNQTMYLSKDIKINKQNNRIIFLQQIVKVCLSVLHHCHYEA